jgi:ankyrin repeat protein
MGGMDELLLKAATEGNLTAARLALGRGASKDASTDFGFTAMHVAASYGHLPIVLLLIEAGADVNRRDRHGTSTLHQAIGWPEVMEALLNAGADVDGVTFQGVTPLMSAAAFGEMQSVRLLVARGADVNRREGVGGAKAAECAREKGEDEIAALLEGLER